MGQSLFACVPIARIEYKQSLDEIFTLVWNQTELLMIEMIVELCYFAENNLLSIALKGKIATDEGV